MKSKIRVSIERFMPLEIKEVEYIEPTVVLRGDDWQMSVTCPWQLCKDGVPIVGWESEEIEDLIWELAGLAITSVMPQTHDHPGDANFVVTEGLLLQISADTDLDPWVLRLPDITIVGSTSFEV